MAAARGVVYSFVIPIFNEQAVLPLLVHRLRALFDKLDGPAEAIFVDDGSSDASAVFLEGLARAGPGWRVLSLSRNFGHQIAITAGMDAAAGEAVIVMDADLQDPPEVALEMIARWREGFHIVTARRLSREGEGAFKRWSAALFYRLLGRVSAIAVEPDVGDFRLVDRRVVDVFKAMPERDRYVRGMFSWLGFRQTQVAFHRPPRAAGETNYPFVKMLRLAIDGMIGFSDAPLRAAIWAGFAVSLGALVYGAYVFGLAFARNDFVPGWASTVVVVSFLSGVNMLLAGIVGLYVGRIYQEVKRRPLYVVAARAGFEAAREAERAPAAVGPVREAARR